MEQEKKHIDELIANYLIGSSDENALNELKTWIATSPENEQYFIQQREVWFSVVSREATLKYNKDKAFDTFKNRIESHKKMEETSRQKFRLSVFWRYAAVVAVILAVGCFSYWQGGVNVKDSFADISVEAPLGSKTKLYLPDGTLVWLNAGSRMTYSQGFGVDNRTVELEGEGYFEVKRNEKLPFVIQTTDMDLRVLGTKFNFKNYVEDDEAAVCLVEGKVSLKNKCIACGDVILSPSEKIVMNKETGEMKRFTIKSEDARAWTNGELFFNEVYLIDIARALERSYGVDIEVADSLKKRRFYGDFLRDGQSLDDILRMLTSTGHMKFKFEKNRYTLY